MLLLLATATAVSLHQLWNAKNRSYLKSFGVTLLDEKQTSIFSANLKRQKTTAATTIQWHRYADNTAEPLTRQLCVKDENTEKNRWT